LFRCSNTINWDPEFNTGNALLFPSAFLVLPLLRATRLVSA
jgi:hypothetical protein